MMKKDVCDFVRKCEVVYIATTNLDGVAETRAVLNSFDFKSSNNPEFYFTTHMDSCKIKQIQKNNKGSLYYFMEQDSLKLFGTFKIIEDKKLKEKLYKPEFNAYYPKGVNDELYGLIQFIPNKYKYYDASHNVLEGECDCCKK
ncbi:MAG: pyridoxamine 5'-phosphate oxidase family protein [Rickettsiales bacterium]|jgi:general stress protein 26|nr:pyridoxamine 5'-phosphate oxidase family protein [Rickettsiales bacterium]